MSFLQSLQFIIGQAAAPAKSENSTAGFLTMLIPFALMFVLLYFLIIRPQKKKEQQRIQMIQNAKVNDYVLTSGGIYGSIVSVKDNEVTLRIDDANGTKIKLAKSAIIGVEPSGKKEEGANEQFSRISGVRPMICPFAARPTERLQSFGRVDAGLH